MSRIRNCLINGFLVVLSLSLSFLFLEFVVFRFILIAADIPRLDFVDGIVKFEPNQRGVWRVKDEVKASYNINANGWNSIHNQYDMHKATSKYRIAIIGNSFVQAFQVDFDKSLAEQLESRLGKERFEVIRFGIRGAPMSQYLHMLRKEVMAYQPDLVVVILGHNDFSESYQYKQGRDTSNFLKIKIENGIVSEEVQPKQFQKQWYTLIIENSATWRYLAVRQKVRFETLRDLILGQKVANEEYQANIPVSTIDIDRVNNEIVTNYIFRKIKEYCNNYGVELLVVMDANRQAIYSNLDLHETEVFSLHVIAKNAAQENGIHFIDLHPVFENDFAENHKMFNFEIDAHWNVYGHQVVADTVFQYIRDHRLAPIE